MRSRAPFARVLFIVGSCTVLDALEQVWVEWKRLLWGELGMAVREIRLTAGRAFSSASR